MSIIDRFKLNGKCAVITGGARGIGKKAATALLEAGAVIVIADILEDAGKKTVDDINKAGGNAIFVHVDVTDENSVENLANKAVQKFGTVDILFNNAGICINEKAEESTYQQWLKVINVNLNGVFLAAQKIGKVMIKQGGGSIINTASMSGHIVNFPQPQCAYNASKAGVIQLTKSLAVEWSKHNVRVNSISPGYIATKMTKKAKDSWKKDWIKDSVVKRMGEPDELCGAILYLASDASTFTTGTDIIIDGGFTCR